MRNNTSQCGVVSSDTHTSVRQHIPSAAPATPRPSSPGRVTRPWSFQHPAHTRLPPCCEPWLCGRGTSGSARPADRPWARHNGSAHAFCHLYTALAHQEGRFSARSVRTRPAKGVGKPQLTSRTPATAPQLFRVLTSNDQETNFSWGSHPSSKLHPQRPHQSADRRSQTHSVRSRSRLDTRFVRRIRAERGVLYLPWECNRELRALRACNKHAAQRNECDATCRPQRQRP